MSKLPNGNLICKIPVALGFIVKFLLKIIKLLESLKEQLILNGQTKNLANKTRNSKFFFDNYQERLEFCSQNLFIYDFLMSEVSMTSRPPPQNLIVKNLGEVAFVVEKFLKLRHSTMLL